VANLEKKVGLQVEGVVYGVRSESLLRLDCYEGGYERKPVTVILAHDGSEQEALVYVAQPQLVEDELVPSPHYLERIFEGGDGIFSDAYEERLKRMASGN
jgi:gamma-glutamylcyclotransferase (GGCT)/AIG2-like uncharacterized protein YtfP